MTISEPLSGARPIVGTVGACSLMLLACSWFVLGPGDLGRSRDVSTPAPVHIGHLTGRRAAGGALNRVPGHHNPPAQPARTREVSTKRIAALHTAIAPTAEPDSTPAPPSPVVAATAPGIAAGQPAPEPTAIPTPPLPAPFDGLPQVTSPPVSVPQMPTVPLPDVSTVTAPLGLP